ncbi:MAG TPA: PBP1A family penicillin-binding protein [Vicinamibacterales bacterium]|nr:PBP1A family penicillin-binding protein [Vicinamibacterales bacterium]
MRLPAFRSKAISGALARLRRSATRVPRPAWLRPVLAAIAVVLILVTTAWVARYAWAINKLNRGVGGTVFLDASGREWFRLDEQRRDVPLSQMSVYLKDAVIAVEDHRYFSHPGVDPIGLSRALFTNLSTDRTQGGSTITQQLARTLFLSNARTPVRKAKEAALAVMLETFLSKREILELYLNRVFLSGGVYGVEMMSQKMLRKPASQLTLAEAALIAGIIRAPSTYSPWNHPDAARRRSFVVLQRMREEGKITANQETAARAERIRIQPPPSVTSARNGYAKEFLRQQFRNVYGGDNPPDWKVHTSFLKDVQDAAETAVREGLRRQRVPGLQVALVALDPATGNVLAMVGGSDFATTPFNRAVNSRRQPGSAFKPFVYAVALEQGLSPVSRLQGLQQVAIEAPSGIWIPRDERATGRDEMSLREALLESNNAAAVLLQQRVGTRPVLQLTRNLGVSEQPDVPSLALGSGLVTPLELTTAYAVFPNGGFRVRSRGILAVEDAAGQTVESANVVRERVISEETAFQMVTMLQDVVARGTGAGARSYGLSSGFGGKTGSTNDYRDAWFVGFNSSVVVGVWTGFDQPQTIRQGGTGARVALPIWADFMRRVQRRLPSRGFSPPAGLEPHELCLISYQRPVDGCPSYIEYFKDGDDVPTQLCPIHEGTFKEDAVRAVDDLMRAIGRGIRGIFD